MKTKNKLPIANCRLPMDGRACRFASIVNRKSQIVNHLAFTLIELLVVIAIIGILAAFIFPVTGMVKRREYINTASAEMNQIETALDNYKAKYGVYPPGNSSLSPLYNTLYYELSGVTHTNANGGSYTTLDSACTISETDYGNAFKTATPPSSIGGIINCTKGGGEDGTVARDFLPSLKANRFGTSTTPGGVPITNLVTSVGGPDQSYSKALQSQGFSGNPFRYVYPGTNNPSSYDLWVQLVIRGQTNLVCNWSKQIPINSPLP